MGTEQTPPWSIAMDNLADRIERRFDKAEERSDKRFDALEAKLDKHVTAFEAHVKDDATFHTDTTKSFAEIQTRDAVVDKRSDKSWTKFAVISALIFSTLGTITSIYVALHPVVVQAASTLIK